MQDMEKLREAEENLQQLEQKMTTKVHTEEDASSNRSPSSDTDTSQEVQQLKLQLEVRTESEANTNNILLIFAWIEPTFCQKTIHKSQQS